MPRRRLRKAEEAVVDPAVALALAKMRPHLLAIEGVFVEELLPSVPAQLRSEAGRRAMNAVGSELFVATELAALAGEARDGQSKR